MYIWILLATIMVALSFFNVAPRSDKEHALNEIKAATVVNRFKAEHSARLHALECEIIYNKSSQPESGGEGWDGEETGLRRSASGPVDVSSYVPAYTTFVSYLPVGYAIGNNRKDGSGTNYSTSGMKHFIYCLAENAEEEVSDTALDEEVFIACNAQYDERTKNLGERRYLVSFAPIPDRWVSKDGTKTPIPAFVNLLAKTGDKSATFGWLEWVNGGFKLHGVGAAATRAVKLGDKDHTFDDQHKDFFEQRFDADFNYKSDLNSSQARHEKIVSEHVIIPNKSPLWRNSALDVCKEGNPCMFAYEVFPKLDPACRCYNLLRVYYGANGTRKLNLDECYYDAHKDITNEQKINKFTENTYKSQSERYIKFRSYLR